MSKCPTCKQEMPAPPTIKKGDLVEINDGGVSGNYTGIAIVAGVEVISGRIRAVLISGQHAGESLTYREDRCTLIHGYIHVNRQPAAPVATPWYADAEKVVY